MKVIFEQLKAVFNWVLILCGVDSEMVDVCVEMFVCIIEFGVYFYGVNCFFCFI